MVIFLFPLNLLIVLYIVINTLDIIVIIIHKGENVGNTIKLVSGFILFVIGVLIAYETIIYNLISILFFVALIIGIVGLIMIVSYFIDSNAIRTTNMIKEFIETGENNVNSFRRQERKSINDGPLKVRSNDNGNRNINFGEFAENDYSNFSENENYASFEDNPKAVLNVAHHQENNDNFDNQLEFTPNYDKPLKVTRTPKKRSLNGYIPEVQDIIVEKDRTDEIRRALAEDEIIVEHDVDTQKQVEPEIASNRDIKIDVNNPESLPIPKSLNSYVISNEGLLTSKEAFDNLANYVNKEIMLEIPSLNDLSDRFLSHVPTIYSRVIINEFDVSDMSYMFLISSLLKQGVHIKTVPKVHSINLITDDSHAMIISEGNDDMEYGAIYNDRHSISNIRADFEKTWNLASNLDDKIIDGSVV